MMRIIFERTGGLMGRTVELDLNLADLPPDQTGTLQLLVEESDFFNLTEPLQKSSTPDGFTYSITVETETNQHTIHAGDTNFPQALRPLLNDLMARTRAR